MQTQPVNKSQHTSLDPPTHFISRAIYTEDAEYLHVHTYAYLHMYTTDDHVTNFTGDFKSKTGYGTEAMESLKEMS